MNRPKLHSLLVGVAKNKYPCYELKGCVNDVNAVKRCLQELSLGYFEEENYKILVNEAASRRKVVESFQNHLITPAQPGDVAVFYFSGHGGQELAPPELAPYEVDSKLEGIVCYDSHKKGVPKLIDKEMRYLIHLLAKKQCDIITIFDCCHSGDNTRYKIPPEDQARQVRQEDPMRRRDWGEMLVLPDHPLQDLRKLHSNSLEELLPQGQHIHLAACLDYEVAFESGKYEQGYFTKALVEALDASQGPISYLQLQRYVQHQLRQTNFTQNQTPQIYTPNGFEAELNKSFLFGDRVDQTLYGNVSYNKYKKYWSIDLGGIHGIVAGAGKNRMGVSVQTAHNTREQAYIAEVAVDHSKLVFACEEQEAEREEKFPQSESLKCHQRINTEKRYKGYIGGLMTYPLNVYLEGEQEGLKFFEKYKDGMNFSDLPIKWVDDLAESSYAVYAEKRGFQLVRSWQKQEAARGIDGYTDESAQMVIQQLQTISRWTFAKKLNPPLESSLPMNSPIEFTLLPSNGEEISLQNSFETISMTHADPDSPIMFRLKFVNKYHRPLYFSLLYLDQQFGIHTGFLQPNMVKLEAFNTENFSVFANSGEFVRMRMPQYIQQLNWPEEIVYFKLISSTQPFSLAVYHQEPLNAPDRRFRDLAKGFEPLDSKEIGDRWTAQLVECRLKNTGYKAKNSR